MQRTGPQTKEPGGAIGFWGNGSLRGNVHLEEGPANISIVARGTNFDGEWPKVHVTLGPRIVASLTVDSATPTEYTVQVQVAQADTSALDVALVNYVGIPGRPLAGRNLLVQQITLRQS